MLVNRNTNSKILFIINKSKVYTQINTVTKYIENKTNCNRAATARLSKYSFFRCRACVSSNELNYFSCLNSYCCKIFRTASCTCWTCPGAWTTILPAWSSSAWAERRALGRWLKAAVCSSLCAGKYVEKINYYDFVLNKTAFKII